ncbi:MAG: hypothetical protein RL557_268, partial [archaeon]
MKKSTELSIILLITFFITLTGVILSVLLAPIVNSYFEQKNHPHLIIEIGEYDKENFTF